jgi:hypothetical protein
VAPPRRNTTLKTSSSPERPRPCTAFADVPPITRGRPPPRDHEGGEEPALPTTLQQVLSAQGDAVTKPQVTNTRLITDTDRTQPYH